MEYVSYEQSRRSPNLIVGGNPNEATLVTLSNLKGNTTPEALKADLSAESTFKYFEHGELIIEADYVSSDRFDEDNLVSAFTLINLEEAWELRDLLVEVARAGAFNTYADRDAAHICFILQAWQNPERSPLKKKLFFDPEHDITSILYEELLPRFSKIIEKVDYLEQYWSGSDAKLTRTEATLQNGILECEEFDDLDLAIFTTHGDNPRERSVRNIHSFAIHNATDKLRILLLAQDEYELYYRYESSIELVSSKTAPRLELTPLAEALSRMEAYGEWQFDGCDKKVPRLKLSTGKSPTIERKKFRELVLEYLRAKSGAQ